MKNKKKREKKKVDFEEPFYYYDQNIRRRTWKSLCFPSVQIEAMLIKHAVTPPEGGSLKAAKSGRFCTGAQGFQQL